MNLSRTTDNRPNRAETSADPVIPFDTVASVLRRLRKDDQVTLTLFNDTITNGLVDLISINGDVLWVLTPGGRQMFMQEDVKDLTRLTPQPESTCQKS